MLTVSRADTFYDGSQKFINNVLVQVYEYVQNKFHTRNATNLRLGVVV